MDMPALTASLAVQDLDARENLTPWPAGVFVGGEFRFARQAAARVNILE
jgi:hypothetical protein